MVVVAVLKEAQQGGLLDISDADRANDRPFTCANRPATKEMTNPVHSTFMEAL